MPKIKGFLVIALVNMLLFGFFTKSSQAVVDPFIYTNNKYGIHILSEHDIEKASELVNSHGGEWGYVTLVIRQDERDITRWNKLMNTLSEKKLIPIVRIATTMNENGWDKPEINEAENWAIFLNQLSWPIQNRYIVLFNEPNHAREWNGEINPQEYAAISRKYWEWLKRYNEDFFVLPAALDLAAPNSKTTMNAIDFFDQMYESDELIFTIFDGWNSHSYPNPAFSGHPDDIGKMSLKGYEWEINYLNKYYLRRNSPIFITETGWAVSDKELAAEYYIHAYTQKWTDKRIIAITPFLLYYNSEPFNKFSFLNLDKSENEIFEAIKSLPKIKGMREINQM